MREWHRKYSERGLVIVGIHTPEFPQESRPANVKKAISELGIKFPVAMDNDYTAWKRYKNQAWPAFYLVDQDSQVVYTHIGEGEYDRTERRIQQLLNAAPR